MNKKYGSQNVKWFVHASCADCLYLEPAVSAIPISGNVYIFALVIISYHAAVAAAVAATAGVSVVYVFSR